MAEQVFPPSPEIPIGQMIDDLLRIAAIPNAKIEQLSGCLARLSGIPSSEELERVVVEVIDDPNDGAAVLLALQNIEQGSVPVVLDTVDQLRQRYEQLKGDLNDELFDKLKSNLPLLICDHPAIARYNDANSLAKLTGNTAERVDVLCDIRPVFSRTEAAVVGLIPKFVMRLAFESQDGNDHVVEVNLPDSVLESLARRMQAVQDEMKAIRTIGHEWVPNGLTTIR